MSRLAKRAAGWGIISLLVGSFIFGIGYLLSEKEGIPYIEGVAIATAIIVFALQVTGLVLAALYLLTED